MEKELLQKIANDEDLMDDFIINLNEQIASDDEPPRKKFSRLKDAYEENPALVDNVLMALCGWTMSSLVEQTT